MKFPLLVSFIFLSVILSSCGAIETIFKAGMWWAFILIGLGIALVVFIISKTRKK